MNAINWLLTREDGLGQLRESEREQVADFALLWTYFEATALDTGANCRTIVQLAERVCQQGSLTTDLLKSHFIYFIDRYAKDGVMTNNFIGLHFRPGERAYEDLTRQALLGKLAEDKDILSAMLLIILRYRNNLFHGIKWKYRLEGQQENFERAIAVMIAVMESHSWAEEGHKPHQ